MKKRLICQMSPLNRPVSKRTSRRKESMLGKKGFHKLDTQPYEPLVSFNASDCDVSGLSSSKSTGIKTSGFSAAQVSSPKNQGPVKNQNHDDNPQGMDEIYLKAAEIERRKSSPLKAVSATSKSPSISKRRYSEPFLSCGKMSVDGLDGVNHSHTEEATKGWMGKKEKGENVDVDKQPLDPGVPFTSDCDVSGLSPNWSSGKPQESEETYLISSVMKRKKSPSLKTISVAARSAKILKRRYNAPFLSPGKRLLSRCMHGLDGSGRPRTVSMTALDMKKQEEAIRSRIRTKRKNRKVDVGTKPPKTEVSFTKSHATSEVSSVRSPWLKADEFLVDSSKPKGQDDHPQEIDEIHLKPASVKGKKSSSCKTVPSRSSRIPKQRYTSSFLYSPGKRVISRCMLGLDEIHQETVSMTTTDMNEQKETTDSKIRKKNGKLSIDTHSPTPDYNVCGLSSGRSPGMKTKDFLDDLSETQENDDNLQGINEIYLTPSVMKKKKSPVWKSVSLAPRSHKIWKGRNSMPFLSPGKRVLSKSMHGLDTIHRRRTVSMTIVDMKKLQEFIDSSQMRKRKRNGKVNVDTQPDGKGTTLSASDHDIPGSSSSPVVEADILWAGSSKFPKQDKHSQGINEIHLKQAKIKRRKSASFVTMASKSPGILKRRYSASLLSPGKRSLSRSMHGLHGIHRCTVSMTTVEMKKLQEVVKNHSRNKEKKNGKFDDTTQLEGAVGTSLTVNNLEVSGSSRSLEMEADVFLTESSRTQEQDDQPQGFDEIHSKQAGSKRKTSSLHKTLASSSQTIPKRRYSSSFLSPRKRLLSGSKHGLDGIDRRTVSMTTVDMKKLDEVIKDQLRKKNKNEKVDDKTQVDGPADTSVTVSSHEVSGSSTSSGVEADVFLASLVLNKTQESSQTLETAQELHRSNDNHDTPKITKTKESPSCKKISAKSRSPRVQKHRKIVPFVSPGKRLLSRSMRGLDEIHRCHNLSMTKVKRKKLQEAIDLTQLRKKKKSEKLGPNPLDSVKSPYQKTEEIVNTALDTVMESIPLTCLKRQQQSTHEPGLSLQDKAVAHAQKECEETITHATDFEVEVKSAKTSDLDFKELDEMYNRRFNPDQKCNQADLNFEKFDDKKQFVQSQKCTRAEVDIDTVTRILSFQDEQKDSNKESPPIIQRCAFAGDIIDPESEVSDSIIDEANETLLEKEIRNFFESKKGHYPRNIREGNLAFDTAPGCVQEQRENEVTESGPIISTGQMNQSQPIPEDNIIIIDEDTHYRTPESLTDIEYLKELAEEIHKSIPDSPRETGDLQQDAKNTHRSITGSDKETKDLQKETENTHHIIQDSPKSTGDLQKYAENACGYTEDSLRDIGDQQKLTKNTQDSPRRSTGDLQKLAVNTQTSITGSDKGSEDLQKELENTHHIIQDRPRSTGDLKKLAENTNHSNTGCHKETEDLQKELEKTHHILQDCPRSTGGLQKCAENVHGDHTADSRITIEDPLKVSKNTHHCIGDGPKENEDLQEVSKNGHHIISESPRDMEYLKKVPDNSHCGTTDSPRDSEVLQKLTGNTSVPCSQENKDRKTVFKRKHNQQTVPMEEIIEQTLLRRGGSLGNQDHAVAGMVNDFDELMLVDTEGDRPWNDSCPPFQHSTPADPANHPESSRISTDDLFSAWAEIEQEEKMFVLYCHEDTAPCILKDLEKCPDIVDRESLSMRYLSDGYSVEVKGMVLKEKDPVRAETCPKKNKKDAAKEEEEGKQENVTMTREAEKKNVRPNVDAVTKKKKSGTKKKTKRGQEMKAEMKKVVKRKTKQEIKSAGIIERKVEAITDAKKELIQGTTNEINKKNGKKIKKTARKESKQETEVRTKKESKREVTKKTKKGMEKGPKGEIQNDSKLKVKMETKRTTKKEVKEKKKDEMKTITEEEVREMKKDTTKETKKKTKKKTQEKTQEKTQNKIKKETKKETKIEAKFSRDPISGKWTVINIPVNGSTRKMQKARKKSPLKTQYKVTKKTKLETKMEKCEVTVSQDPTSRKLKMISGPIKGPARKKNESRWEHELREQSETPWSEISVQPSMESDCCMMRCLRGTAWTTLKQQEKGYIVQDRVQDSEDDDPDLGTFVDLVSFPDVFTTAQKDRPSFHKVPPSEIQIFDGFLAADLCRSHLLCPTP